MNNFTAQIITRDQKVRNQVVHRQDDRIWYQVRSQVKVQVWIQIWNSVRSQVRNLAIEVDLASNGSIMISVG